MRKQLTGGMIALTIAVGAANIETDGQSRSQPILRTNRVMRGVVLPPGEHRLVYRYRPKSFYAGAIVSAMTSAGVGIALLARWRRKPPAKPQAVR